MNALLMTLPTHAKASERLIVIQGNVLNAYYAGQYKEIKRADVLYGYGWLDEKHVFVAYQKSGPEAVAELEVIDLVRSKAVHLATLGGVGDSNFDVNDSTGLVVFNDVEGIHLLIINPETNAHRIEYIKKDFDCWGVFWIDDETVGCQVLQDGRKFVSFTVPHYLQGNVKGLRPNRSAK